MTKTQKFIKGISLSALLTFATSCSNGNQTGTSDKTYTLADSILFQAQKQAKDLKFMKNTDYNFNTGAIFCDYFYKDSIAEKHIAKCQADSIRYGNALVQDAYLFKNMDDFNKSFETAKKDPNTTNFIYINYCKYRRSLAKLNLIRQEYKKRTK